VGGKKNVDSTLFFHTHWVETTCMLAKYNKEIKILQKLTYYVIEAFIVG